MNVQQVAPDFSQKSIPLLVRRRSFGLSKEQIVDAKYQTNFLEEALRDTQDIDASIMVLNRLKITKPSLFFANPKAHLHIHRLKLICKREDGRFTLNPLLQCSSQNSWSIRESSVSAPSSPVGASFREPSRLSPLSPRSSRVFSLPVTEPAGGDLALGLTSE